MKIKKILISIYILAFAQSIVAQISFTESSYSQNINVSHGTGTFVGGISFFDFNNDGWDDLSFSSSRWESGLFFSK